MKAVRTLKSQAGFSLIELMIVVAIIGILASIAVPNFKKFQVKARQSEAKAQLTSLFTAEKAFYGEWNSYYSDFRDIGYNPEGKMRYLVGFPTAAVPAIAAPFNPSVAGGVGAPAQNTRLAVANPTFTFTIDPTLVGAFAVAPAGGICVVGADPTAGTFHASATSTIAALGSTANDSWTMDQAKVLCNNVSGI